MTGRIHTVRREFHLKHVIAADIEIFRGRSAGKRSTVGKHHDSGVAGAETDFILGTYHAVGFHASYFRFLDFKLLVAVIEYGPYRGHDHGLSGSHVGSSAYNLHRLSRAEIHCGDM